jgi:ribulose-bisphosphate carboxylase large chain
MLIGFDTMRYIAETYKLAIIGHPSLAGTFFHTQYHGMTPAVLLGTLYRLLGADISVFPNAGGRFLFTQQECTELADALRKPLGTFPASFPCPAGGMSYDKISILAETYGEDSVLLIGGALMQHSPDPAVSTRVFMDSLRKHFSERLEQPGEGFVSSCELHAPVSSAAVVDMLPCNNYVWHGNGRAIEPYKGTAAQPDYYGILRQELIGTFGEKTAFDVRYFEIEPGGNSSLEKHVHEHVIIGVRGKGTLVKQGKHFPIHVHDVAYVQPLEVHQLRNNEQEPFGFFCIVDHERDKPMQP